MSKRKNKRVVCVEPSKADINRVMEAAGLLKDSLVDEQAKKIEELEKSVDKYKLLVKGYRLELGKLQEADMRLAAHFEGVCAERDNLAACLKSAENALAYKDKVIDKIKKNNAKRVARLRENVDILEEETAFQYKRANKADAFIKQIDGACDLIKKHIAAYGRK